MTLMHREQGIGRIVALSMALLFLVQAQVMSGQMPDRTRMLDGGVSGSCLPSCEPASGVFYQSAAVLPMAAPAIPESLKRHQYDGPDRRLQDAWQGASNCPAASPPYTSAEARSGWSTSGSGKLCALLCTYRL